MSSLLAWHEADDCSLQQMCQQHFAAAVMSTSHDPHGVCRLMLMLSWCKCSQRLAGLMLSLVKGNTLKSYNSFTNALDELVLVSCTVKYVAGFQWPDSTNPIAFVECPGMEKQGSSTSYHNGMEAWFVANIVRRLMSGPHALQPEESSHHTLDRSALSYANIALWPALRHADLSLQSSAAAIVVLCR